MKSFIFLDEQHFENEDLFSGWRNKSEVNGKTISIFEFILYIKRETDISEFNRRETSYILLQFIPKMRNLSPNRRKFLINVWFKGYFVKKKKSHHNHRDEKEFASEFADEMKEELNLTVHAITMASCKRGNRDLAIVLNRTSKNPEQMEKMKN